MKMALFLAHLKARNCSSKTIKDYESDLRLFEGFLKERHLRVTQVKPQTIDQFVEWLRSRHNYKTGTTGMADATIRRRLSSLSSFYDFLRATSNGRISNPLRVLHRIRRSRRLVEVVPERTVEELLEGINVLRDKALFSLFLASGLRLSELHQLNRDSIAVKQRVLDGKPISMGVGRVMGKGRKERVFLVEPSAEDEQAHNPGTAPLLVPAAGAQPPQGSRLAACLCHAVGERGNPGSRPAGAYGA